MRIPCTTDDDCVNNAYNFPLNSCDPYELRCYNSVPEQTWCKTDDHCGIISLLAACEKGKTVMYHDELRYLCFDATFEGDKLDDSQHYYFMSSFNLFKGMLMTPTYNPSLDIPPDAVREPLFYSPTIGHKKAVGIYGKLQSAIQDGLIQQLDIEYIFFNVINQIGLYYKISLGQDSFSDFSLQSSVSAFFPKIFDKDSVYPNLKSQLIAFRALFAFVLLFRILKVIFVDLYKLVKTFIQTHKLNLPLSLIFNMGILIVLTIVLVVSITNNFNMANTVDPFLPCKESLLHPPTYHCSTDTELFDLYKSYATNTTFFLRILAVAIFLIVVEILLLLNTQFPSFGVLFVTLGKARKELFYFLVVLFTLIAGFLVFLMLNFGLQDNNMSTIGSGFVLLFQYLVGSTDYRALKNANPTLGQIFFFLYYVIFNLVLVLIFIVIIMTTYVELRKKLQMITLALAALAADKSREMKDKYIKLLTCVPPTDKKKEGNVEKAAPKKKDYKQILLYNLDEVDWFGLTNNNRETRDQIEKKIHDKIEEIKKQRRRAKILKARARKKGLFSKFSSLILNICFIIIYVSTMDF